MKYGVEINQKVLDGLKHIGLFDFWPDDPEDLLGRHAVCVCKTPHPNHVPDMMHYGLITKADGKAGNLWITIHLTSGGDISGPQESLFLVPSMVVSSNPTVDPRPTGNGEKE